METGSSYVYISDEDESFHEVEVDETTEAQNLWADDVPQPNNSSTSSFGQQPQQSSFGPGFVPSQPQQNMYSQPLFGQPQQQQNVNSSPLFGQQPQQQQNGLFGFGFGSTQPQQQQNAPSFGYSQPQQNMSSPPLFGQQPPQQSSFGSGFAPIQPQQQNVPSFGATTNPFDFGQQPQQQQNAENAKKKKLRFKAATTNIVSIDFGKLAQDVAIATGDAIFCQGCRAVFSHISKVEKKENQQAWNCEFCGSMNNVQLEPEEIPVSDSVDYIIAPSSSSISSTESSSVIFVVDISGSMGVSYEVQGTVSLKGKEKVDRLQQLAERSNTGQVADQWLPNERRGITYVTRLQCVQAAIANQIESMATSHPNKKVSVISFNNEVTMLGNGIQSPSIITGDKLFDYQTLYQAGEEFSVNTPVKESKDSLTSKLFSLEEGGSTALGPALVCALGMSSKKPGSSIVICTDGLSNVGLGSLDDLHTDEEKEKASKFYEQIGQVAQTEGISISVISIKGSDCSIENLGSLSQLSGGTVDRVDPLDITKNFQSILSLPVIATHVQLEIHLHKGLFIRQDESDSQLKSHEVRQIGNVTKESTTTVDYGIRQSCRQEFAKLTSLPFQIQITYTRTSDGMKCMRVISKTQDITFDRAQAEEHANFGVIGTHSIQKSADMAQKGDYNQARFFNLAHKQLFTRAAKTEKQVSQANSWAKRGFELETELSKVQREEQSKGISFEEDEAPEQEKKAKKSEKMKSRKNARNDSTSNMLYKFKSDKLE